jgi:ligand-binding SRPBCC domain-containing protein
VYSENRCKKRGEKSKIIQTTEIRAAITIVSIEEKFRWANNRKPR